MTLASEPVAGSIPVWNARLRRSDSSAMAELFEATHDDLLRYVRALLGDRAEANDVVQEAFIRIWSARSSLDPARSLLALLYRTARNLALNHLRDERTRERLLARHEAPFQWRDPGPEALQAERELSEQLSRLVEQLPPRQREALTLSRVQGLSHEEIAAVMGVAPRTVNNHLVRALEHLRDRLNVSSTGGRS